MEITKTGEIQETEQYEYYLPTSGKWMKKVTQAVWEAWEPQVKITEHEPELTEG